ncbi:MAG: (2Fe-2S)-binding protein [Acidobacteriaceae bacterium]|nr:(2Fe-2S)-binding protein [Acidobacteriaceae bacterium]
MPDDQLPNGNPEKQQSETTNVSRRDFLKISGISAAAVPVLGTKVVHAAGSPVKVYGPGKVSVELTINGKTHALQVEPRVTLLDAIRDQLEITGAKRVCDRAECGACTVIMDGKAVYACSVLAIEAQRKQITTVESLMEGEKLHPIQQAFVDNDASQCGFCTPGFVVALKAFLDKHPNATPSEIRKGLSGNLCRCGTYHGLQMAVALLAQKGA